jgi:6-phosphogluconolactonase
VSRPATKVVVHDEAAGLARQVAADVLTVITNAQAEGREPHVALTGGSIADALHRELARQSAESSADWSRVHVWWGDERFVPADSPDRNAGQAAEALLDHVCVEPGHVHAMPAADDVPDVEAGAVAYAEELRTLGGGEFDLVMLGVGPDGHVASLFPGFPQLDVVDDIAVAVTGSPKPPPERISLTFPALNRARAVWFLVAGAEKADAVGRSLPHASQTAGEASDMAGETSGMTGERSHPCSDESLPAVRVHGRLETVWHIDRAAGSLLDG